MSYERLARALLQGWEYYGPALRSLQGLPERYRCMPPLVAAVAETSGDRALQILEIGSWAGASAVSWARAASRQPHSGRVVCIDCWQPYLNLEVETDQIYADMNAAAERGDVFRLFLHNLRAAGVLDRVEYHIGVSRDILPRFQPASFDIIYVDGSHAAEDVAFDLMHAARLVRDDGVVCGDDLELQRDAIAPEDHLAALASRRDYVWLESAGVHYHPGVTEAVATAIGPVFAWNGFWAARRRNAQWEWLEFEPGPLPPHIAEAVRASESDRVTGGDERRAAPASELAGESVAYNFLRLGNRYVAVAKALGPVALGVEKLGDRDLDPVLFVGTSIDELRARVAPFEQVPSPDRTPNAPSASPKAS